ncbi:hypothetical protein PMIN02_011972 [Paraphaeosphaeria minitans]
MENIKILGRLDAKGTKLAASAAAVLNTKTNNREGRISQTFLRDIHRQCGPEQVVLCAAGLGKQRVVCLNNKERTWLVQYVKSCAVIFASPFLHAVAQECQIPERDERLKQVPDPLDRKRSISVVTGDDRLEGHNSHPCQEDGQTDVPSKEDDKASKKQKVKDMGDGGVTPRESRAEVQQHANAIPSERRIEYRYSEAPIALIPYLGEILTPAMQTSNQWKWERQLEGSTTDCLNLLSPKNRNQDISITIVVGFKAGMQLVQPQKWRSY